MGAEVVLEMTLAVSAADRSRTTQVASSGGSGRLHRLLRAYVRCRFGVLFYSLLLTFAAAPLLSLLGFSTNLIELFLSFNLIAAVIPFGVGRTRRALLVVVAVILLVKLVAAASGSSSLKTADLALWTAATMFAAYNALRFALRATVVNLECLYAALSAYLLAGMATGVFYWMIEGAWPGSLAVSGEALPAHISITHAIYFSFVTLATLGYGDVLPKSELARGVAVLEALVGQLYLAVMIARLVSLYVMSAERSTSPGERGGAGKNGGTGS